MPPPPPKQNSSNTGLPSFTEQKENDLELPEIPELEMPQAGPQPTVPKLSDTGHSIPTTPAFGSQRPKPAPRVPTNDLFKSHDEMPGFDSLKEAPMPLFKEHSFEEKPFERKPLFDKPKPFVPVKHEDDEHDAYKHTPAMPAHTQAFREGDVVYLKGEIYRELIESIDAAINHHKAYLAKQDKETTSIREENDFDKFMNIIEDIQRSLVLTEAALFE